MMAHRKREHLNIKECQQFLSTDRCRFGDGCWWSHENEGDMNSSSNNTEGFWETPINMDPDPSVHKPVKNVEKTSMNSKLMIQIMDAMKQIMMNLHICNK